MRQDAAKLFTARRRKKVILYLQGRRGFPRRHDVVVPRRFGVPKDIEPPNVSRVTTGSNGRQRAATGGNGRQRAATGGKGGRVTAVRRQRASCITPARHRRGGFSSKRGAHYQFRKVPRRKSSASPGVSCVPQKCAIKGAFVRYNDAPPPGWLLL